MFSSILAWFAKLVIVEKIKAFLKERGILKSEKPACKCKTKCSERAVMTIDVGSLPVEEAIEKVKEEMEARKEPVEDFPVVTDATPEPALQPTGKAPAKKRPKPRRSNRRPAQRGGQRSARAK